MSENKHDFLSPGSETRSYRELLAETELWHGTGRYQYDDRGEVIDVLGNLLNAGSFSPKADNWDLNQPMTTTSFARERDYGRLYADMHHTNPSAAERHTSQAELVKKYVKGIGRKALREHIRTNGIRETIKAIPVAHKTLVTEGRWSKKVNSTAPPIKKVFTIGSDIPGNYPMLFGVRDIQPVHRLSQYLADHEVRTTEAVTLDQVTHIEVPRDKVSETQRMLNENDYDIPVIAIEKAEQL